jgi:DNA-binding MarR family transcriptional regulator
MAESGGEGKKRKRRASSKVRRELDYDILPNLVGYQIRRAQLAVFQDFMEAMSAHSITPGQFGVLVLIDANQGLNQSQLGEAMGVDRSTMVAVIDKLENAGYVLRQTAPNDRRSYALKLSKAGVTLLSQLRPAVLNHERNLTASLSGDEQRQLIDSLKRIADSKQ